MKTQLKYIKGIVIVAICLSLIAILSNRYLRSATSNPNAPEIATTKTDNPVTSLPLYLKNPSPALQTLHTLVVAKSWSKAVAFAQTIDIKSLAVPEQPIFLYLRARSYKALFENESPDYDQTGILNQPSKAFDYLTSAIDNYSLVTGYSDNFLADDAQGWVGGCYYRMGAYTKALNAYIEQAKRFPHGDTTIRFHADDLYFSVRGILRFWNQMPQKLKNEAIDLFRVGNVFRQMGESRGVFPPVFWSRIPRRDVDCVIDDLRLADEIEPFLHKTGGDQLAFYCMPWLKYTVAPAEDLPPAESSVTLTTERTDFTNCVEHLFYTGDYKTCLSISQGLLPHVGSTFRESLTPLAWLCSAKMDGAVAGIRMASSLNDRNGVIALAYDFATTEELDLLESDITLPDEHREVIGYIHACRLIAAEDYSAAMKKLFQLLSDFPAGQLRSQFIWRLGEMQYFLCADEPRALSSSDVPSTAPTDDLQGIEQLPEILLGKEFCARNHDSLNMLWARYQAMEALAWGRREIHLQDKAFRLAFAGGLAIIVHDLISLPDYDSVPLKSRKVIDNIFLACSATPPGILKQFQLEKRAVLAVMQSFYGAGDAMTQTDFDSTAKPLLQLVWRLANAGKYTRTPQGTLSYRLFHKADYLFDNANIYRDVNITNGGWDSDAYSHLYYLQARDLPPMLAGLPYRQASKLYRRLAGDSAASPYDSISLLRCNLAEYDLYSLMRQQQWNWQQTLYKMESAVSTTPMPIPMARENIELSNATPLVPGKDGLEDLQTLQDQERVPSLPNVHAGLDQLGVNGIKLPFGTQPSQLLSSIISDLNQFINHQPDSTLIPRARDAREKCQVALGTAPSPAKNDKPMAGDASPEMVASRSSVKNEVASDQTPVRIIAALQQVLLNRCDDAIMLLRSIPPQQRELNLEMSYIRAMAHARSGKTELCVGDLLEMLSHDPDSEKVPLFLDLLVSECSSSSKTASRAIPVLQSLYLQARPFNNRYFIALALRDLYVENGDVDNAKALWKEISSTDYSTKEITFVQQSSCDTATGNLITSMSSLIRPGRFEFIMYRGKIVGPLQIQP